MNFVGVTAHFDQEALALEADEVQWIRWAHLIRGRGQICARLAPMIGRRLELARPNISLRLPSGFSGQENNGFCLLQGTAYSE